jgi:hypothetical protein
VDLSGEGVDPVGFDAGSQLVLYGPAWSRSTMVAGRPVILPTS